jgi:hypothetical protein
LKEIKQLFLGTKKKKMFKTIQFIFDSITSQPASVVGCKLTVETPNGEQISINVENVQERPVQSVQHSQGLSYGPYFPKCRGIEGKSHHTVRSIKPKCANHSELIFDILSMFFETGSIEGIEPFFQVPQSSDEHIQRELCGIVGYTKPLIHLRIIMILILKLYETVSNSKHNPHPYFFVLKPLFQVNRKNLRNEYSIRIASFVQNIALREISQESLVNLIFEFGKYVGKDFFFKTLHESRHYRISGSSMRHIFNKKISNFIVDFFKKNPEINQRAISEFGEPINIW